MTTARQIADAGDAHILERLQGGAVKRYTQADGVRIEKDDLEEISMIAERYRAIANREERGGFRQTDFEVIPKW